MKDFFDDFSGIVHIPGGAVEYENGVLVERKEKPLNKKPTCRVIARQKIPSGRAIDRKEKKMKKKTFEEWKAANSFEIEDLADYFIIHDTENYFVHEKYLEAYEKIESLCKLAFDRE